MAPGLEAPIFSVIWPSASGFAWPSLSALSGCSGGGSVSRRSWADQPGSSSPPLVRVPCRSSSVRVLAGHYFFPSIPFFALAFGTLALPAVASFHSEPGSISWRAPAWIAVGLLTTAVAVVSTHGSLEVRNTSLIRDLDAVRAVAPVGQTIGACPGSGDDWGLVNYWQRFYRISLQTDGAPANGWFLVASEPSDRCAVPSGCGPVAATSEFSLLRCGKP